jgi:hypothetical protein
LSGRLKPQLHFRTVAPKPPPARQAGEVGLETWRGQTQRTPSDRLDRPYSQQAETASRSHACTARIMGNPQYRTEGK